MNDLRDRYRRRLPAGEVDSETGELVEGGEQAATGQPGAAEVAEALQTSSRTAAASPIGAGTDEE